MRYFVHDPDEETVRRAVAAWTLAWFSSVSLGEIDDAGRRLVLVEPSEDFDKAPDDLVRWFRGSAFQKFNE